jgi:hypothetical protein
MKLLRINSPAGVSPAFGARLCAKHQPQRARHFQRVQCLRRAAAGSATTAALLLIWGAAISLRAQTNSSGPGDMFKLAPPYPEIQPTVWETYHWAIIIGVIVFVLALALMVWSILKPQPAVVVPPETVAREALAKLSGRPEDGACLSKVSQILRHYFVAAFQLPAGEMTTAEMAAIMAAHDSIGADLGGRVAHFLLECDQRKFAPLPLPASGAANRALELINLGEDRRRWQMSKKTLTIPE